MNHLDQILKLLDALAALPFETVEIADGDVTVKVGRHGAPATPPAAQPEGDETASVQIAAPVKEEDDGLLAVVSPIIGVFFTAPSPEEAAFARVGDRVQAGQTLCIVEAMKLMNEIPSPASGILRKILPQDGSEVEVGQTLFLLEVEE